jgi:hypothetical protein
MLRLLQLSDARGVESTEKLPADANSGISFSSHSKVVRHYKSYAKVVCFVLLDS